jgi:hypothetical protein
MANIKFSQFTAEADINNFDDIVGYQGAVNKKITPANLASSLITLSGGPYLPLVAGNGNPLTGDLYIGDATAAAANLFFQTTGNPGDEVDIQSQGQQFMIHELGTEFRIGPNDDILIDDSGAGKISMAQPVAFQNDILDINGVTGNPGQMLASIGGSNAGVDWVNAYQLVQVFQWNNGNPVAYTNFPPPPAPPGTNTISFLPFNTTPSLQVTNLPAAVVNPFTDYGWTCNNAAGGDAGQIAAFTLGANGAGTWLIRTGQHWFDQNAFVDVNCDLVISPTVGPTVTIRIVNDRHNDGDGDKLMYGELFYTFAAGDVVQVQIGFSNYGAGALSNPFPSDQGDRPIEVSFEKIA